MAKAIPNPEPPWQGNALDRGGSAREKAPRLGGTPANSGREPWDTDELLGKEATTPGTGDTDAHASQLQAENSELRSIIAELQQELENVSNKSDQAWADRQKEYDSLIDEKNEMIRELHLRLQELEEVAQRPATPKEEELRALSEELERERCQLQQERRQLDEEVRQLREDSDVMNQEMRQMEVQMARERADLARQRNEVQRVSDEIRHELDRVERDRGLSDRLVQLRQRHMDAVRGKSAIPPSPANTQPPRANAPQAETDGKDDKQQDSTGILRRFFR
jgi:DNA repair exonuclease SbcCD ATPase subunit